MRADLVLVGFGNVGRRFARLIEERRDWLSPDYDLDCRVVGLATRHLRGVVNSTTNHILSALEDGEGFDAALERMQALGIAEADASLDVDGWDAAAKVSALANVFMRARLTPQAVEREGIGPATARQAMAAKARGARVRLVAAARTTPGGVVTSVRPVELPESDLLARLRGL